MTPGMSPADETTWVWYSPDMHRHLRAVSREPGRQVTMISLLPEGKIGCLQTPSEFPPVVGWKDVRLVGHYLRRDIAYAHAWQVAVDP
jgi:hypothetical protein